MKRIFIFLTALLLASCGNESDLPEASGKANFRAINAVPTSGEVSFLIEEVAIGLVGYRDISTTRDFDDLEYNFNFDVFYAGELGLRRVARQFVNAVADRDYTFIISGTLANPTITLLEDEIREFDASGNVFAAKFLHTSQTVDALDFYFADPTTPPAPGGHVARLSPGEVSAGIDFAEGAYVITLTTAGDHTDIVYTSEAVFFAPANSVFITLFDGDENDNSPLIVDALPTLGASVPMRDPSYPPTVEFVNVSLELGATDIYDDEQLTSRIVSDHDYLDVANELPISAGANSFFYTPAGDTAAFVLDGQLTATSGARYRFYAAGIAPDFATDIVVPDRKSLETMAKVTMYQASNNFSFLDLYIVDADETVDENFATRPRVARGTQTVNAALEAGSYDIYITEFNNKTVLAGPYRVDVVLGDIVDLAVVDTVDPAVLDVLFLSGGPTT